MHTTAWKPLQMPNTPEPRFADLLTPAAYQAQATRIFQTPNALEWFMRRNMTELAELGAVVAPTGRKLINTEKMEQAVREIGRRRAIDRRW